MRTGSEDRQENAARLVHEQRHRSGTAQICDSCRALASGAPPRPGPALRQRLGRLEQPASAAYRALFFNIGSFVERTVAAAPTARRILEIGCGDGDVAGALTEAYPMAEYTGIDVAPAPGRRFRGDRSRASFSVETSTQLLARHPAPFDLVIIADVLHHVPEETDRAGLLADAAALTDAGGVVLVKEWERTGSAAYWAGWAADYFISGDRAVHYLNRSNLLALINSAAPELHHRYVTTTRPWQCNVVHVLSRDHHVPPRPGAGLVDPTP